MAPRAGFEPATNRLTAGCSTAELPGKAYARVNPAAYSKTVSSLPTGFITAVPVFSDIPFDRKTCFCRSGMLRGSCAIEQAEICATNEQARPEIPDFRLLDIAAQSRVLRVAVRYARREKAADGHLATLPGAMPSVNGALLERCAMASWRSGYATDCKSGHPGSIPGEASSAAGSGTWRVLASAGLKPTR